MKVENNLKYEIEQHSISHTENLSNNNFHQLFLKLFLTNFVFNIMQDELEIARIRNTVNIPHTHIQKHTHTFTRINIHTHNNTLTNYLRNELQCPQCFYYYHFYTHDEWKSVNRKNLLLNLSSFLFEYKMENKIPLFLIISLHNYFNNTHTWLEHFSSMSMWNVRSHKYAIFSFLYFQVSHINKTELTLCTSPPRPLSHYNLDFYRYVMEW